MSNFNIDMCCCCGEIWNRNNQKQISLGRHSLYLCPHCYHEYVISCNEMLDKIRAEIENYKLSEDELSDADEDSVKWGMKIAYDIIDKYKAESEE